MSKADLKDVGTGSISGAEEAERMEELHRAGSPVEAMKSLSEESGTPGPPDAMKKAEPARQHPALPLQEKVR